MSALPAMDLGSQEMRVCRVADLPETVFGL